MEDLENDDPVPGPSKQIPTVSYKVDQDQVRILGAQPDQRPVAENSKEDNNAASDQPQQTEKKEEN